MADVFLSYARQDRSKAQQLAESLARLGWSVFWDRVIPSGPRFRDVIQKELECAKCIVVLWSRASVQSDWVIDEADEGKSTGRLVAATIDDVKPPYGYRGLQTASLANWDGSHLDAEFGLFVRGISVHAPSPGSIDRSAALPTGAMLYKDLDAATHPNDLPGLEGSWLDEESGSAFYAQMIGRELVAPYGYGSSKELTGVFFKWSKKGSYWFARYAWLNARATGFTFLNRQSANVLQGAWWPDEHGTGDPVAPPLDNTGFPSTWRRNQEAPFPSWATEVLKDVQSKGLGTILRSE